MRARRLLALASLLAALGCGKGPTPPAGAEPKGATEPPAAEPPGPAPKDEVPGPPPAPEVVPVSPADRASLDAAEKKGARVDGPLASGGYQVSIEGGTDATAAQAVTLSGFTKAVVYNVTDTVANIVAVAGAALNDAVNISATGVATVAQATTIEAATHSTVSTRVEGRPELPLGSRSVRASGGRAGTMAGLKMASTTMNSA